MTRRFPDGAIGGVHHMARIIDDAQVENAARALLGAIDTGDGGTPEQHAVLQAFVAGYWERPDLDLASLEPLDPAATAAAFPRAAQRHRVREFMVLLEMCRHPQTPEQVALVDRYAAAMGEDGEGLQLARTIVKEGTARAFADFSRFRDEATVHWAEPSLVDRYLAIDAPDRELVDRLLAMHDLPENTLGWHYIDFYRRQGLKLPGEDTYIPAFFVAHDMNHVIAGYGTTGQEETALSAMILGMADTQDHWVLLLTSAAAYELGLHATAAFVGKQEVFARDGAASLIADGFRRGAACTEDFSEIDHLSLAHLPLAEVRQRFGVPPLTAAS
jgi:hypothetical protein